MLFVDFFILIFIGFSFGVVVWFIMVIVFKEVVKIMIFVFWEIFRGDVMFKVRVVVCSVCFFMIICSWINEFVCNIKIVNVGYMF